MKKQCFSGLAAIALLSLTACQTPQSSNATAESAPPDTTVAPPADLAEGVSLSADGQTLILGSGSIFEAYCNGGRAHWRFLPSEKRGRLSGAELWAKLRSL